jgi:hypothetical protein
MIIVAEAALKVAGQSKQNAKVCISSTNQDLVWTRTLLHSIFTPRHFGLECKRTGFVVRSQIARLKVRDIIGPGNDVKLEFQHRWDLSCSS